MLRHHFRLGNVITTVDAVNASCISSRNPEGVKQVAAADRLVVTKTDLADPAQTAAVHEVLARLNPSAEVLEAVHGDDRTRAAPGAAPSPSGRYRVRPGCRRQTPVTSKQLHAHSEAIASLSLVLDEPLDWTAFGVWLSMLLNRHGDNVLRVKGILQVQGTSAPVFINAVQHVVHPPQHLTRWPSDDHRSRIVFITRGLSHALLRRSLAAFADTQVSEGAYA